MARLSLIHKLFLSHMKIALTNRLGIGGLSKSSDAALAFKLLTGMVNIDDSDGR